MVAGIKEIETTSSDEIMQLLHRSYIHSLSLTCSLIFFLPLIHQSLIRLSICFLFHCLLCVYKFVYLFINQFIYLFIYLLIFLNLPVCRGNEKRSQAATAANEVSSRSHAVLQVSVK